MTNADNKREDEPTRSSWTGLLIFACLGLGFAASAAQYERITATAQRSRADIFADMDSVVEGRLEDVGKFLANPQTRLIRLSPSDETGIRGAVIAWNAAAQRGYLLCDQLPVLDQGDTYQLWAIGAANDPVRVATFKPRIGNSVYSFQAGSEIAGKMRVEITAGARSPDKSPILAGEID